MCRQCKVSAASHVCTFRLCHNIYCLLLLQAQSQQQLVLTALANSLRSQFLQIATPAVDNVRGEYNI
jgi:hypothetical protein